MEYVSSTKEPGCIFCAMFEGRDDRSSLVLQRGDTGFLVLNKYPYNNGHLMAAPYRHVDSLEKLTSEELSEMMALTALSIRALRQTLHPEGLNIGANIGQAAGAGVKDHFHLHVVPRWVGDTNFVSLVGETRVIPQTLTDSYDQLRAALSKLEENSSVVP
jgi:ATP adenylyltransferase